MAIPNASSNSHNNNRSLLKRQGNPYHGVAVIALVGFAAFVLIYSAFGGMKVLPLTSTIDSSTKKINTRANNQHQAPVQVEASDYIYQPAWGAAPIVVESHKLIFFWVTKSGCTTFKHLFRRMMGYSDWKTNANVHYPKTNGLRYLNDYSLQEATAMMNSPEFTRALVVRDPKERFLSAYLDKAAARNGTFVVLACCHKTKDCRNQTQSLSGFLKLTESCHNPHWRPQGYRLGRNSRKFVPTLDFIGHMGPTIATDVKVLLERIGAWEDYGKSGWGPYGNESIFASRNDSSASHATSKSAKDSWNHLLPKYFTPEVEAAVEERYDVDYNTPEFELPLRKIDFSFKA